MHCPTLDEITSATLALLPRGRAWQTNEGTPQPGAEIGFAPGAFNNQAFSTTQEIKSILWEYWRSFAVVLQYLTQRLCDLRLEFWCQSVNETRDEWMIEYGLPDACDPFPDLCTKVAAIGGTQCSYYADIAARAGWSIRCAELENACGMRVGGHARVGNSAAVPGYFGQAMIAILVYLNESPAYVAPTTAPVLAGRFLVGNRMRCPANLDPLRCVLSRVIHAHITTIFQPVSEG